MSNVMIGLFAVDTEMLYVSKEVAILISPETDKPTLVVRKAMDTHDQIKAINLALKTSSMRFAGKPFFRKDGLWACEVEAR